MSDHSKGFHGPRCWIVSAIVGLLIGWVISMVAPGGTVGGDDGHEAGHLTEFASPEEAAMPNAVVSADGEHGATAPIPQDLHEPEHDDEHAGSVDAEHDSSHAEHDHAADHADGHGDGHADAHHDEPAPTIPLALVIPFALLLGSIAVMPFISEHFWHRHFPDFAFLLGGIVIAYYLLAFDSSYHGKTYGEYAITHAALEYYAFIALVGGLYVASGGILVNVQGRGGPVLNTGLLAFGAVIANIVGTTGASVLLIRPFMRINKGRLSPIHVVMFIFIVSNCGGCLTPIGDPPLYLGFLKGVPFQWTLLHLWPMWLACVGMLLAMFFVIDSRIPRAETPDIETESQGFGVSIKGLSGIIALGLIIFGVFIDILLRPHVGGTFLEGKPVGATFQIAVAAGAYFIANKKYHEENEFSFFPVQEVGLLFIGIFATMTPALGYLAEHGPALGIDTATKFYFATGSLSGVLDNAPTYLNFMQVSFAAHGHQLTPENVGPYLESPAGTAELMAISLGAVFFGAMTYIGNGPNFMVRAIAESSGLRMPSFFGYLARSMVLLLPVLIVIWLIFVR